MIDPGLGSCGVERIRFSPHLSTSLAGLFVLHENEKYLGTKKGGHKVTQRALARCRNDTQTRNSPQNLTFSSEGPSAPKPLHTWRRSTFENILNVRAVQNHTSQQKEHLARYIEDARIRSATKGMDTSSLHTVVSLLHNRHMLI